MPRWIAGLVTVLGLAGLMRLARGSPTTCTSVTVPANVNDNCIAGGTYCSNENDHCGGWWPFRRHCKTTYSSNGSCSCGCS